MSSKNKLTMITLALLILIDMFSLGYIFREAKNDDYISANEAMKQLEKSLEYKEGQLSFQIPKGYPNTSEWNIMVPGRIQINGFGFSVHYFTVVNDKRGWKAGKRYIISINEEQIENYTELKLFAYLTDDNGKEIEFSIDLLAFLKEEIAK